MNSKDIFDFFDAGGLLSQSLSRFEYREGQQLMAQDAFSCFENKSVYAVEAGTGIGKSFAYLVPALDRAFINDEDRTVIATSTINLQKQIVEKDIPALFNTFGKKCNVELAVGRSNYICKRKLKEIYESNALLESVGQGRLTAFMHFAENSETGLLTDFKGFTDKEILSEISSDSDTCRGPKCPFFAKCFYYLSKRRLSNASVIICNHHLLLTDCISRIESEIEYDKEAVLPPFKHLVIDEAHNLEKNATSVFTREFSNIALNRQLEYLHSDARARKMVDSDKNIVDKIAKHTNDLNLVNEVLNSIQTLKMLSDSMNAQISAFLLDNRIMTVHVNKNNIQRLLSAIGTACLNLCTAGKQLTDLLTRLLRKIVNTDETETLINQLSSRLDKIISLINIVDRKSVV